MQSNESTSPKEAIVESIRSGVVRMRPRWHFALLTLLSVTGAVAAGATVLFIVSLAVFSLRSSGAWYTPEFGGAGVRELFRSLPWFLVLLAAAFMLILELLVKRYGFVHRSPLLYSALAVLLIGTFGGIAVANSGMHQRFYRMASDRHLAFAERLYRPHGPRDTQRVRIGFVTGFGPRGFGIRIPDGDELAVVVGPETRFPRGAGLAEGDAVAVFGPRRGAEVSALGIRRVDPRTILARTVPSSEKGRVRMFGRDATAPRCLPVPAESHLPTIR